MSITRLRLCGLILFGLLFAGCQTNPTKLPVGVSPVQATWLYGKFTIPPAFTKSGLPVTYRQSVGDPGWTQLAVANIKPGLKVPVVLYMHGCKGISRQADRYSKLLNSEGFAVFMPDSFQRPGRLACREQGTLQERVALRTQEVDYALSQIKQLSWVNQNRVMLMGFSEGGNTVDNWSKPGFAAYLIMSSACTLVGGAPAVPAGVPVLAIVGSNDQFRPGESCTIDRADGMSQSIVIKGAGHTVAQYPATQKAIRTFLHKCCS